MNQPQASFLIVSLLSQGQQNRVFTLSSQGLPPDPQAASSPAFWMNSWTTSRIRGESHSHWKDSDRIPCVEDSHNTGLLSVQPWQVPEKTTQMHPARNSIRNQGWIQSWSEGQSPEDNWSHHQNLRLLRLSCPRVSARYLKSKFCENHKEAVTRHLHPHSQMGNLPPRMCN